MLPPEDVSAADLFRKLLETPAPSEVFDFPQWGVKEKIRVLVLSMDDHHAARLAGEQWLANRRISKEAKDGHASQEALGDRIGQEIIAMSIVSVDQIEGSEATGAPRYRRIFATADDVGKLAADVVRALFSAYVLTQHRYGPHAGNVADESEQTAWIQRLTEGASANPLSVLSYPELAELTCGLAQRAYSFSVILDSLRSTLPDTLVSALESWGIGTCSFGSEHVDASVRLPLGLAGRPSSEPATESALIPPDAEPLTQEAALKLARELFSKE